MPNSSILLLAMRFTQSKKSVPTLEAILQKKDLLAKELAGTHTTLLFIHGSVAKRKTKALSDLDVAVLFDENYTLSDVTGLTRKIETVLGSDIDLAVMNTASPLLCMQVLKNGICLFGDKKNLVKFRLKTINRYLSTKHLRTQFYRYTGLAIGGN